VFPASAVYVGGPLLAFFFFFFEGLIERTCSRVLVAPDIKPFFFFPFLFFHQNQT